MTPRECFRKTSKRSWSTLVRTLTPFGTPSSLYSFWSMGRIGTRSWTCSFASTKRMNTATIGSPFSTAPSVSYLATSPCLLCSRGCSFWIKRNRMRRSSSRAISKSFGKQWKHLIKKIAVKSKTGAAIDWAYAVWDSKGYTQLSIKNFLSISNH